jgi:hypothetical protein
MSRLILWPLDRPCEGVTRVGDSDKPEQANLPRYNQKT